MYKLTLVLKEKLILWIIHVVNANNKNFALYLENAFLHKRSSLLHKSSMYLNSLSNSC